MAAADVATVTAILTETTLDDVSSRHRKERKELQAKIQAMKKNAPKSDKKKRKEAMEEVTRLEGEMEQRHAAELKAASSKSHDQKDEPEDEPTTKEDTQAAAKATDDTNNSSVDEPTQRVSKAQKRREKKAQEARQREEDILAAADEAQFAPKAVEARNMQAKLKERQLALQQVPSDGDCLYNAIRHQLLYTGLGAHSVQQLRNETANYIRANKDALICYMTHPRTGDLLNDEEFEKYCEAVRTTPAWGGQIELKALSAVLKVPIEVLQAEGPAIMQTAEGLAGPPLTITYHRHMYSLGEHYNSTVPLADAPPAEDSEEQLQK